jgi:hypothetical protein
MIAHLWVVRRERRISHFFFLSGFVFVSKSGALMHGAESLLSWLLDSR